MRVPAGLLTALATALASCSPRPLTRADVSRYTGLRLCDGAHVRDLTTAEERDTTRGFSFHVQVALPQTCEEAFQGQIAALPGGECARMLQGNACSVEDASLRGATNKHSTIVATSLGGGRYDLRFYE